VHLGHGAGRRGDLLAARRATAGRAGRTVAALLGAANRDPAVFAAPDRLDVGRSPTRTSASAPASTTCSGDCRSGWGPFVIVRKSTKEEATMKYLMLVCVDGSVDLSREDEPVAAGAVEPDPTEVWLAETGTRRLDGDRLRPPAEATTVRVRGGQTVLTDGPFAETKEQIAGYDVLDCADLDEAIEIASKHPVAAFGMLELRPFWTG
jgi:hypothetical protein